jgi:type II restriction enzyme
MAINLDKPHLWKKDILRSVDFYNAWFTEFAPHAFRQTRAATTGNVQRALKITNYLRNISPKLLEEHPNLLPILRLSSCPPIARDRLVGLAGVSRHLVRCMENSDNPHIPQREDKSLLEKELKSLSDVFTRLSDPDIFPWLADGRTPNADEILRSSTVVADRLCSSFTDPIIRNAQEKRQLAAIASYLENKGYREAENGVPFDKMTAGTFSFRSIVPVFISGGEGDKVNISVDVVIMPASAQAGDMPLLIEAKSAGDFTNVNKRRKEESMKMQQLKNTFGSRVSYTLFLCGYFDSGYLGYEAAEGIDWVWEHRITDLDKLGI